MMVNRQFFKYTKRKWAEGLALRGEIRLGTLFGFRNLERYGATLGDTGEGMKTRYDNPLATRGSGLSPFAAAVARPFFHELLEEAIFNQCLFEAPAELS